MIDAYITNLGRYNECCLDGEYLKLPTTTEEVQALLRRIHVDGVRYEEIFITDYELSISGLHDCLDEYEDIDELNYLAALLDDLDEQELATFSAALAYGDSTSGAKALINLAQNLDCYNFFPNIADEDDLGRYYIEELCTLDVPEHLQPYFDYEAYGRDMSLEDGGVFTDGGYVMPNGSSFDEVYSGREDIPDEYRIFVYPERGNIRDTLEQYRQMADSAPAAPKEHPAPERTER